MDDEVKRILAEHIRLAEKVSKVANEARYCKQDCFDLKSKTENLATLLRQAARECSDLKECPILQITEELFWILHKGLSLVLKCRANILNRLFAKIPVATFRMVSSYLEDLIADVTWLLSRSENRYLGVPPVYETHWKEDIPIPPIVAKEPDICFIWKKIIILYTGSDRDRSSAASSLDIIACKRNHYGKLNIEKRWLSPLLKLLNEGWMEEQEIATRAIGLLGRFSESVEHMIQLGVCSLFAKILEEGPIMVQAAVAWAVSELADSYPKCQDPFARHNIIRLLVDHLAFEFVEENCKYGIFSVSPTFKTGSDISSISMKWHKRLPMHEMAARALWYLAKGNFPICCIILESGALLCFAALLEMEPEAVRYNSVMAVLEITTVVAEKDADLRESAFDPNSPGYKAIVDQLIRIIDKEDSAYLIPCVKTIGNLARTFKTTGIISPLATLLYMRRQETELIREVLITFTRFACTENDLHIDHSKEILSTVTATSLVKLVSLGDQMVYVPALILLSYIALHLPHSKQFAKAEVLEVLEWASEQSTITQDEHVEELLIESKSRLEFYHSRGLRIPQS